MAGRLERLRERLAARKRRKAHARYLKEKAEKRSKQGIGVGGPGPPAP